MRTTFVNGQVLDGDGGVLDRIAAVTIEEGTIVAVGPPGDGERPAPTDRVVDLSGRTLLPGLIDTHVHCVGGDYTPGYEDQAEGMAVLRTAEVMRKTLDAGITTVRTAGSRDHLDIIVRDAINAGVIPGPRMIASGRGLTITGGHLAGICQEVDDASEAVKGVREHFKAGADSIKIMMSAGAATGGRDITASQFNFDEVQAMVQEVHRAGRKVLTHAIGPQAIRDAVAAGVDSIDHGYHLDEETAQQMRDTGIYLVPTFCPGHYYTRVRLAEPWRIERAEATWALRKVSFELALQVGVPIAMGSDCGAPSRMPNGRNALELELMVEHGMSPSDAIHAGTGAAADLLGLDDVGRVAVGQVADLIVVDGDPLSDITVLQEGVRLVMQAGQVIRDDLRTGIEQAA